MNKQSKYIYRNIYIYIYIHHIQIHTVSYINIIKTKQQNKKHTLKKLINFNNKNQNQKQYTYKTCLTLILENKQRTF